MNQMKLAAIATAAFASILAQAPADAQSLPQIGVDPWGAPMCMGPLGPGRCADIIAWIQRGGAGVPLPPPTVPPPMPMPPMGPMGPMGLPTGLVTHDGQLVAQIAQACNGEPSCIAAAWATEEFSRCSNGVGVPGGCFGPNGEIRRAIETVLNDIQHGPGSSNDVFGEDGWVCENLLGGC